MKSGPGIEMPGLFHLNFVPIICSTRDRYRACHFHQDAPFAEEETSSAAMRQLLLLSAPVFAEHALHILVGWNDTYLANHIHQYHVATHLTRA